MDAYRNETTIAQEARWENDPLLAVNLKIGKEGKMKKTTDCLGKTTIERMKGTRWFAFAKFIDELRYNMVDIDKEHLKICSEVYVGDNAKKLGCSSPSNRVNTDKILIELRDELEGLAIREVT